MIGVAKNDLSLDLLAQFAKMHSFHATYSAYRHKDRCLYLSVVGGNQSGTGIAGCISMLYFECHLIFLFVFSFFRNSEIKWIVYNLIGQSKLPNILYILYIVECNTLEVHIWNLENILFVLLTH